jgi:2-polyprenyl-3-methyl-5-hydroxy-6-metoxy-1,4-benzoquinol methylase
MIARRLQPELLDHLPPDDPRAIRSRRDLRRVNAWMGQAALMAKLIRRAPTPPRTILEIGCGDGTFLLRVARRLDWTNIRLTLVDRQNLVTPATIAAYAERGWTATPHTADVFDALRTERADIVTANLFLHHFEGNELRALLAAMAQAAPFAAACEPRRSTTALLGSALLFVIGCNHVTRHDAAVSVRAGFTAQELAALWPAPPQWHITESPAGLFTHAFTAWNGRA